MPIVYDTILSAIHNAGGQVYRWAPIVYDTILSAIHNVIPPCDFQKVIVYDTILSAISKNVGAKISIMIDFTK